MTGEQLQQWMDRARIGYEDLAKLLSSGEKPITRQRVFQWCNDGDAISAYWQARIETVMADVDAADRARIASMECVA